MSEVAAPAAVNPGKGLGIAGLVLSFFMFGLNLVGLILSIIGLKKSKAAGMSNGPAVAGIIISILTIIATLAIVGGLIAGAVALGSACADYGPGVHDLGNGTTLTCG